MKSILTVLWTAVAASWPGATTAFAPSSWHSRPDTRVFLEDRIARMIDDELYRQSHKKEFENQWMEKNRGAFFHHLGTDEEASSVTSSMALQDEDDEYLSFGQYKKDRHMAVADPERYCADRCVSTGNCDVFEDFYHLSPTQVLDFCEECVLSDEGECNLPEDFYEVGKLMP